MVRNLFRFGLTTLCLAVLSGGVHAYEPPTTDGQKLESIKRQLDGIQEQLDKRVLYAEGELLNLKRRMDELEARLRVLSDAEAAVRARVAKAITPSTLSGSILLQNRSAWNATIHLDGVSYDLAPYQTLPLPPRPVGTVNYEVFAGSWGRILPLTSVQLVAGRPLTIFVYDR